MGNQEYLFTDDTQEAADEFIRQGGGGHADPQHGSDFSRLASGKTLGKRIVLLRTTGQADAVAPVDLLEVRGDDNDAMPLGITFIPPIALPTVGLVLPSNTQDISGGDSNFGAIGAGGPLPSGLPAAFLWDQLLGIVEWGIGGVSYQAVVDIGNGCSLNVYGSFVRLRAIIGLVGGSDDAAYTIGAFVGPAHASPTHSQFTDRYGAVNAGADGSVRAIPWFARAITIVANTDDVIYSVRFYRDLAATAEVGRYFFTSATPGGTLPGTKLPIPGAGAYYYRIHNGSGNAQNYRAIFDLAI